MWAWMVSIPLTVLFHYSLIFRHSLSFISAFLSIKISFSLPIISRFGSYSFGPLLRFLCNHVIAKSLFLYVMTDALCA